MALTVKRDVYDKLTNGLMDIAEVPANYRVLDYLVCENDVITCESLHINGVTEYKTTKKALPSKYRRAGFLWRKKKLVYAGTTEIYDDIMRAFADIISIPKGVYIERLECWNGVFTAQTDKDQADFFAKVYVR